MTLTFSRMFRLLAIFVLALAFSVPVSRPLPVRAAAFTVDTLTDETDGECVQDCSLRDAIALANSNVGPDTIEFDVTGTIAVSGTCLPSLEDDGTTIDGTTAPGYAGTPLVAITAGVGLSCGITAGIYIDSDDNTLKGLAVHSFGDDCIDIDGGSGNVIGPGMVISNCGAGVYIGGPAADNTIQDSFIGTDVTGMSAWGNDWTGVYLFNMSGPGACSNNHLLDNVISGNDGYGIRQQGANVHDTEVKGNKIGVAADGVTPLGNDGAGISIGYDSHDNRIGGALEGDANIIAYNASTIPDTGIAITHEGSDGNRIAHNSIYDNTGLGIDLGDDGVTCNSPSEDEPNDFLPCPVINSATTSLVSGTTCPNCIVEVFIADPDPSGYGEGRTYLGDTETTDGNFTVTVSGVEACDWLTATAIGQNEDYGNTSEFALNVQVPCTERTPTPVHRRTATPTTEPTDTPQPPTPTLFPPLVITPTPAGGAGPVIAPPSTGEGASAGGFPWPVVALVLAGAVAATATGAAGLRTRGSRR